MSDHSSIFEQDWWYQAATDGHWQQAEYGDCRNLHAKLIFVCHKSRGITTIEMPVLARVMQPVIQFARADAKGSISDTVRMLQGLADCLPTFDRFRYTLPPESELDLAYCLAGYSVNVKYTFRTNPCDNRDPLSRMDQKVRYNIKTGSKRMGVEAHDDIRRYITLSGRFISDRAFKDIVNYDAIERIWEACRARGQASIISCVDGNGHDIASAILLWDSRFLYYWLNCRNPKSNDYTANSVLLWSAMEIARKAERIFDADGYASPNAGLFLSRFGLLPRRRFDISLTNSSARLKAAFSSHLVDVVGPKLRQRLLTVRNAVYRPKGRVALTQ